MREAMGMTIIAKYSGKCRKCGGPINPGDKINWDKSTRLTEHVECPEQTEATKTYSLGGGSGYGCNGWTKGQIVRADKYDRERGYPEWLYVLSASRQYYREDGMSFGVGDERGYYYTATCREATPEEAAPYITKREVALKAKAARARLEEIKREIRKRGTMPSASDDNAQGKRVFDTQTIYGGGDWLVINDAEIWYVENNGMDGDDWSRNNVVTGGAGAIGWMIPRDEMLVTELRELAVTIKN
jgi:hypothetical protein